MTIKVAKDGYNSTCFPGTGLLLIDGALHQSVQPVSGGPSLWIPVRNYTGPVEHVDTRGKPFAAAPAEGGDRG